MKLSVEDSNALKGIAILMMLWHHLFYYSNDSFNDIYINGYGLAKTSALACKVCVAIFVFVSGYGLMEKYKITSSLRTKAFYRSHFVKLLFNYWFVWIPMVILGVFWGNPPIEVQYSGMNLQRILLDFMGISSWFGLPQYNPHWWFYGCIIGLYLLFPIIQSIIKKSPIFALCLAVVVFYLPSNMLMCVRDYFLTFIVGIIFSQYGKNTPPNGRTFSASVWGILLVVMFICRYKLGYTMSYEYDAAFTVVLAVTYRSVAKKIKLKRLLSFFGHYSMDIFLVHYFIYNWWGHKIIYASHNPFIIFLTLIVLSTLTALIIEWLKNLIGFKKLVQIARG